MKHLIITVILVIATQITFSQYYLGLNEKEARALIKESEGNPLVKKTVLPDQETCLTWHISKATPSSSTLYFDKNGNVYVLCVVPDSNDMVNALVKIFNDSYVKIADDEWNYYADSGMIVRIKVQYIVATGKYAIYFSERE